MASTVFLAPGGAHGRFLGGESRHWRPVRYGAAEGSGIRDGAGGRWAEVRAFTQQVNTRWNSAGRMGHAPTQLFDGHS
jgi:hypothetical protein